ncbi:Uncharacterized protein PCOAH_00012680 [Plasmodium coatneyi]|uniref:Plasmodium RESA N-terminal domain-containing protein n=1 Tax=Plasmodium coatneyi TaxID=208452 RepID=A0A1B1DVC5_9APIC|nr:Uncharacterized protein PCOAH_00012680 [Plasmodium coatneyi]ANQ06720.1 Uncharacterized protein PCOAH_00012680 [Plasmodium coatneyi]
MSHSSSESLFVSPELYEDHGMHMQEFYDNEIESYVHRGGKRRRNIRRGGRGSSRGSKNVLSKIFMLSSFSSLLSSSPTEGIMENPRIPGHQINAYGNYYRRVPRKSKYLQMVDHLKRVRRGSVTDSVLGDYYNHVSSNESIDLGSEWSSGIRSNGENDSVWNLSDGSLDDIEIGEEVFEDSILINSNYDKIRLLKHNKVIEDDDVPVDCEAADFYANMTEEEIFERIQNLDDPVPFRDMFIVYNSFHENERKKFKKMQNLLKIFLESMSKKELLDEEYRKEVWTHISSYMIQELLKKDFEDFKSLYKLADMGECTIDEYVHFIRGKKSSWKFFLRHMDGIGRNMIYDAVARGPHKRRDQAVS